MVSLPETEIISLFSLARGQAARHRIERTGYALYRQAVVAARSPAFYTELAVADTLDGRFDMICLHVVLLTRRLVRPAASPGPGGAPLAQAVFDAMFTDMDGCLREAGVGDLGVPRRVRAMWEAYNGRAHAYGEALDHDDATALSEALVRNIWRGQEKAAVEARLLAGWVMRQQAALAVQPDAELRSGTVRFLETPSPGFRRGDQGRGDRGNSQGSSDDHPA